MGFRSWPGLVKSVLATSADPSKIRNDETSPADMSNVSNDHYLWKKSGAGLVNAERAVQLTHERTPAGLPLEDPLIFLRKQK